MTAYGNRGMSFGALIGYANSRYRQSGAAIIEKQHTLCKPLRNGTGGIVSAKYEEKATVDFMGRYGKRPIAFEAKHCATDVIELKRVEAQRTRALTVQRYVEMGAIQGSRAEVRKFVKKLKTK